MVRQVWILLLIFAALEARENPFLPVETQERAPLPVSTNEIKTYLPLEHEIFTLPDTVRAVTSVTIEYQNLDGSIDTLTKQLDKSVDWHEPIVLTHKKRPLKTATYTSVGTLGFIRFATLGKTMKIETKNKLVRHFMLAKPHRVVMDFERVSHFLSKQFSGLRAPYEMIRIGNHKDYYRVVVDLDGQYEYQLNDTPQGFELVIR